MQIISARDNENSNERETQKKKQRQKRTKRRKVIVKGWELNDFAVFKGQNKLHD